MRWLRSRSRSSRTRNWLRTAWLPTLRCGATETARSRAANKYLDATNTEKTLTAGEIVWADKIRKGVESYLLFAPVITLTGTYDGRPDSGVPGYIATPPVSVDGFEYLKTADRVRQNQDRTWERVQQWTGADEWDTDIYTAEET